MINNRQAGRRRGRGGNNNNNNGPRQGGGGGRPDNGNRIDSRARGNANQLYEKYKNLASDAQRQGDRVNTEYYLQFADHYFRVLSDQRGRFEDQQPRRPVQDFDADDQDEFGDEGEPIRAGEQDGRGAQRDYQGREHPRREERAERQDRSERQERGDRPERAERADRQDRPERQDRAERAERQERPRRTEGERPRRWDREERVERETEQAAMAAAPVEVAGQRRSDPPVAGEDLEQRAETVIEADAPLAVEAPAPRRRGRPRRDAAAVEAAATPATDAPAPAAEANSVDADRLPPSLGIAPANDSEDAPKPRRRRVRTATPEAAAE